MHKKQAAGVPVLIETSASVRQMFLENRQAVHNIIAAAGGLLEKRAMNRVPSEEEMKQIQGRMGEISENLRTMGVKAQEQIQAFGKDQEELARQCGVLTKKQQEQFERLDAAEKAKADMLVRLAREQAMLAEQERLYIQAGQERERLADERKKVMEKARKREEELKKWCWVPGYGLYLAIDALVQDYDSQIRQAIENCERKQDEYVSRSAQLRKIQEQANRIEKEIEGYKSQISARTGQIQEITAKLEETKKELVRWDNLKVRLSGMTSKMDSGAASPEVLLEVLVMMDGCSEDAE